MPTLEWIGKSKVVNHHLEVPYQVLERKYSYDEKGQHDADNGSQNMIIHGDNLAALKSLLPQYEGRIQCIYLDPPYNTGNEGWVYNDNVNDPRIKKWLGEVVGKEGEDLSRHDKWLCMMYPRLKLLQRLLADDGAVFISIDDNEQANLKLICDEIFGANNFVAIFPWRKRTAKSDVPHGISQDYEYILCYAKTASFVGGSEAKERAYYETPDFPGRPWRYHDLTKQTTVEERPKSNFAIKDLKRNIEYPVNPARSWAITIDTYPKYLAANRIIFPGDYDFLQISRPVLRYWKEDDDKKNGGKKRLKAASTYLLSNIVGMTQDGTKEITAIFGKKQFNFPKPSSLIQFLIHIATANNPNAIILDSFAGSGTTAHAVLNLNKQDSGHRKFILIEMMDYADTITAERVKRVIKGYGEGKNQVEGTGGDFSFYELGKPIFKGEFLNEAIGIDEIRKYVYFTETRWPLPSDRSEEPAWLGTWMDVAYYFHYAPQNATTLNWDFLATIKTRAEAYVIYADTCALSEKELLDHHITFKKIPRDIARF